MKKISALALSMLLFGGASCAVASPHDRLVRLNETFRVGGVRIRPLQVIEDSRCPANARCIWAGRVVVRTQIVSGRHRLQTDLTMGEPRLIGNETVTLTTVLPVKYTSPELRPASYRFGFVLIADH